MPMELGVVFELFCLSRSHFPRPMTGNRREVLPDETDIAGKPRLLFPVRFYAGLQLVLPRGRRPKRGHPRDLDHGDLNAVASGNMVLSFALAGQRRFAIIRYESQETAR